MIKQLLIPFIGLMITALYAQAQDPGQAPGDTGTVTFFYKGQTVTHTTVRAANEQIWLRQNLGAQRVGQAPNDTSAYGDYFAWGRWDDGHQRKNSPIALHTTLTGLKNPAALGSGKDTFYYGEPFWWRDGNVSDTWSPATPSATNGKDPCAALGNGWRMPTASDWQSVAHAEGIDSQANAFRSNLRLVLAGGRNEGTTNPGTIIGAGDYGQYHTATPYNNQNVHYFTMHEDMFLDFFPFGIDPMNTFTRGGGFSVRCVKSCTAQETLVRASTCNGSFYQLPGGISVSLPGAYRDSFLSAAGCDSVIITELEVYTATSDTITASLCRGESFPLPNGSSASRPGSYVDSSFNIYGCDSITVFEILDAAAGASVTAENGTAHASGSGRYQWFNCEDETLINGATSNTYTPENKGRFAVIVSNSTCSDTSDCITIFPAGINDAVAAADIAIYPNPAGNNVTIRAPQDVSVSVYAVDGRLVQQGISPGIIQTGSWVPGMYLIEVRHKDGLLLHRTRLVKE